MISYDKIHSNHKYQWALYNINDTYSFNIFFDHCNESPTHPLVREPRRTKPHSNISDFNNRLHNSF